MNTSFLLEGNGAKLRKARGRRPSLAGPSGAKRPSRDSVRTEEMAHRISFDEHFQ